MVNGISNPFGTQMQTAAVLTAAVLIASRKFCLAGACKLASKVVNEQKAARLDQAGNHYLTLAKQDALRDFTAVTGLIATVGLAKCAKEAFSTKEPEKEVGNFENYAIPTIKYGAGVVITGLGLRSLIKAGISYSPKAYLNVYVKFFQWNSQAESMGSCKLPVKLVTKTAINILDQLITL